MISSQSGGLENSPRFGFISPERILSAVDFPIPFLPTSPSTFPEDGTGMRKSLKAFGPNLWLQSFCSSSGMLTIDIALYGHFFMQIPHPTQRTSEIMGLPASNLTASTLLLTCGQNRWHSLLQRFGLHLAKSMTAILIVILLLDSCRMMDAY
jgi:hypothetical protein